MKMGKENHIHAQHQIYIVEKLLLDIVISNT